MSKLNIFISWSKTPSDYIAENLTILLHEILPDDLNIYLSSSNNHGIDAGENFHISLNKELNKSNFGILILTKYNIGSNWLMFEAGALSKHKSSRIVPILFDREIADIENPISGVNYINYTKESFKKLAITIKKSQLKCKVVSEQFLDALDLLLDRSWEDFSRKINLRLKEHTATIDTMEIIKNYNVYDFMLSKREDHLVALIKNLNTDKVSKRLIIFGGISTILRSTQTINALGRWLLQDHAPKIFICHETKESLMARHKDLKEDIVNPKLTPEEQAEEKVKNILEMKANLIEHTAKIAKNRLFFIELPKLISNFITIEGTTMYLTPALDTRSSDTFTFKLKPSTLNIQLLDFISNCIDYKTEDNLIFLNEIEIIKQETEQQL